MMISVLGIDLAKSVFQLHGADPQGRAVLRKKLRRSELLAFVAQLSPCTVAMEACTGAHYWGREFEKLGHQVRLISPQFVKPFVKSNKNDAADAEAIVEAAVRPQMRFVPLKQLWQQDIQSLHRVRERLVRNRTALMNELRGFLAENGITLPRGQASLRKVLFRIDEDSRLSELFKRLARQMEEELRELQSRVEQMDRQIDQIFRSREDCQRIGEIEGVGPITATAMVAAIGDPKVFKNGRQVSAWLGLVPRQCSSGGKQQLLGISKRGDRYLRKLLVHGARSALRSAEIGQTRRCLWIQEKIRTRGKNKTCVAVANHNARIIWALLAKGEHYRMGT